MADYKIVCKLASKEESVEVTRLITARNKAAAMAHVAKTVVSTIEVASTDDILDLGRQGISREKADAGE